MPSYRAGPTSGGWFGRIRSPGTAALRGPRRARPTALLAAAVAAALLAPAAADAQDGASSDDGAPGVEERPGGGGGPGGMGARGGMGAPGGMGGAGDADPFMLASFQSRGLITHDAQHVAPGYVLVAPLMGRSTYLIDNEADIVHEWPSGHGPSAVYLEDDGSILRCQRVDDPPFFHGGGIFGLLERIAPGGEVTWSYELATDSAMIHHDIEPMPNGNILFIAWEAREAREVLARGRHPEALGEEGLWPDMLFELKPTGSEGGEIVWEWRSWDHVVQDLVERGENHGSVARNPQRIDVNGEHRDEPPLTAEQEAEAEAMDEQLRALGYVGGDDEEEDDSRKDADWMHTNAVDHHAGEDLIVISSPHFSELWVIDHSTTTEEAAGHTGGRFGMGGDILWRWGHPRRHGAGSDDDQQLFYQHDPQWLDGSNAGAAPGAGGEAVASDLRLTVFNNGGRRPDGNDRSEVVELVLPFDPETGFAHEPGQPFGPAEPAWTYEQAGTFYSAFISGAQRLPNGNTLICQGVQGRLFEVMPNGRIVWEFRNPYGGDVEPPKGTGGVPPFALFRATRYAPDHPGIVALLGSP